MSDEMKRELNGVKSRLDGVESRLDRVEDSNRSVARHVVALDAKIDGAIERLSDEIRDVSREFRAFWETAVVEIAESRKERRLRDHGYDGLRTRVDDHQARIHRLEVRGGLHDPS